MMMIRCFSVLYFVALTTGECKFDTDSTPDAYVVKEYEASWGVAQAAARTNEPFPNVMELFSTGNIMADPWVMELLTQVALGVVFVGMFLLLWCYFSCCRYKIGCCCNVKRCNWQLPPAIKPMMGKIILACAYGMVIIVGLTAFNGKSIIGASIPAMQDGMTGLGNALSKFVTLSGEQVKVLGDIKKSGDLLASGACDFKYEAPAGTDDNIADALSTQMDVVNSELQTAAQQVVLAIDSALKAAQDVETQLKSADDSISTAMKGVIDMLQTYWESYLDPATLAFALIFVLAGFMGLASSAVPKAYKCTLLLIWCIAGLVMILTAVLLLFSIVLGDLCVPKPTDNIAGLMPSEDSSSGGEMAVGGPAPAADNGGGGEGGGDFIQFFVACKGANPLGPVADDLLTATTTMLEDSCNLLTDLKPASMDIEISLPTPTTHTVSKKTDAACKEAIGDPLTGVGLQGGMGEAQDVLKSMVKEIKSCKFVNAPLTSFLEEGFCNGFAGGFYSMYASLFSAIWFTILAMYITFPAWDVADGTSTENAVAPAVATEAPVPAPVPAAVPAAAPPAADNKLPPI